MIVDYNVNAASDSVIFKRVHLEALVYNTLSCDSSITMDNNRYDLLAIFLFTTEEMLLSSCTSLDTRVDSLQMRRVGHQSQLDFVARLAIGSTEGCTKMVLDVTGASVNSFVASLGSDALEFGHDDFHGLSHNVCERVETTSVGHTDYKCACTFLYSRIDAEFESWDERFTTFKTEALHSVEFLGHEGTPLMGPVEAFVHVNLLSFRDGSELDRLELLTNPIANFTILDMHELHADLATVSFLVGLNQIT